MWDFLIIGGGIAGVSAAARLSDHGAVLLCEAEAATGYHASGRSAALYEANYGLPSTVALNIASGDYHRTAHGGYLSPRGLLLVGGAEDTDMFDHDLQDLGLTEISVEDAIARVPILNRDTVARTAHHDGAWDIDTDRLMQDFLRHLRANGGASRTSCQITGMTAQDSGWVCKTASGEELTARNIVNAAGAWADQIAALAGVRPMGIVPHRRSMARMPAPGGHDLRDWPMLMGVGESWYAKPDAGAWLVSPAEADPTVPHDAYADDMVLAEGIARYQTFVSEEVTRVETTWAGLRSFAPDKALVLGPDPDTPSFIWCAGQGGYGFQTAPAASQLLADLVTGAAPALPADTVAALSPERLR